MFSFVVSKYIYRNMSIYLRNIWKDLQVTIQVEGKEIY